MSAWRRVRLDWVAREERRTVNATDLESDEVFLYSIPVFDETGDGQREPAAEIGSGKLLLSGGEVLISKLNPRMPRILFATRHACPTLASTEFVALRCGPEIDRPFVGYMLASEPFRQYLDSRVQSVTRSQQRVQPDTVTKAWIQIPEREEQRAIADFLDAETARIDALVDAHRRALDLARRRFVTRRARALYLLRGGETSVEEAPLPGGWTRARLRRLFASVRGGAWGGDPGTDELDIACVRVADFDREREIAAPANPTIRSLSRNLVDRIELCPGDLLLEKSGGGEQQPVGYVVGIDLDQRAICSNFIARLRPLDPRMSQYLAHLFACIYDLRLNVPYVNQTTGIQNLDVEAFLAQTCPIPPLEQQGALASELDRDRAAVVRLRREIDRQIALLQERKQALITAAVTGQLDVTKGAA